MTPPLEKAVLKRTGTAEVLETQAIQESHGELGSTFAVGTPCVTSLGNQNSTLQKYR